MSVEEEEWILTLDQLPYLCLMKICEFLKADDLARFSRVCKTCYEAATGEALWRGHCLSRWAFCDINQIQDGGQRWRRYYTARRRVENRMDQGRPVRDYRVKSLRDHKEDIITAVSLNGSSVNWEHPTPPLIISLSLDSTVHVWSVAEGKSIWSVEDQGITCLACDDQTNMVAMGDVTGHVTLYNATDWSVQGTLTSNGSIAALKFGKVHLKQSTCNILMVSDMITSVITIWNSNSLEMTTPLATLSSSHVACSHLLLSAGQWLAGYDKTNNIIPIWDLCKILSGPLLQESHDPHVTLHPQTLGSCLWLQPGVLATMSTPQQHYIIGQPLPGPIPGPPGLVQQPPGLIPGPPGPIPVPVPLPRPHWQRRIHFPVVQSVAEMEVWQIEKHIEEAKKPSSDVYQVAHMYDPQTTQLECTGICTVLRQANGLLLAGNDTGKLFVIDPQSGKCLQQFTDHKGSITDIYADSYRVLSCSKDFSIRVYRWIKPQIEGAPLILESRYQLLGGSIAHKTHDGFHQVICDAGSCVGVAGNVMKLYNFIHQLE